jgi:hypothetical protein
MAVGFHDRVYPDEEDAMLLEITLRQDLDLILGVEEPIEVEWSTLAEYVRLDPDENELDGDDEESDASDEIDPWED